MKTVCHYLLSHHNGEKKSTTRDVEQTRTNGLEKIPKKIVLPLRITLGKVKRQRH